MAFALRLGCACVSTPTHILLLKDKVQRYLSELVNSFEVTRDGDFTFQQGLSRIFIRCDTWYEDRTLVRLTVPLLLDVEPSADLFEYVALHADDFVFGHLAAHRNEQDRVDLFFVHILLGDYLDPEELMSAVGGMAVSADELDNELQAEFGGRRFHE